LGLAEWVPCVFESGRADAEMLYPVGSGVDPAFLTDDEFSFAEAAWNAATQMLDRRASNISGNTIIAPLPAHITAPHMRGVLRTRYRAHTTATQRWAANSAKLKQTSASFLTALA
jgi:hypothetical protein